jgi:hypothetical protein
MAGAGEALPRPGPGRNGRGGRHPGSHASAPGGLTRRKRRGAADPGLRAPPARSSPSMLFRASRAHRRTDARASARRSVSGPCGWGIRGGSGSCSRPTSQDSAHLSPSRPEAAARSSSRVAVMHAVGSPRPGARSARAANRDGLWWSNPIVASRRSARTDNGEAGSAPCGGGVRAAVVRLFGPGERPPSGARRQQAPGEARESLSGAAAPLFLTSLLSYFLTRPCRLVRERGAEGHRPPARLAGQAGCGAGRGGDNAARECGASGRAGTVRAMARSDHTGAWFHAGVPMRCREGRLRRPAPDEPRQDLAGSASGSARRNARERNSPSGSCPGRSRHRRLPRRTRPTPGFVMSGFV